MDISFILKQKQLWREPLFEECRRKIEKMKEKRKKQEIQKEKHEAF